MGRLFLGKWWHWLMLAILVGLLWQAGLAKMHVSQFNWFVLLLLGGTIVSVLALIYTTRQGEQITREVLQHPEQIEDISDP